MMRFLMEAGPWIFPILLLAMIIAAMSLWNAARLLARRPGPLGRRRRSIDAVLFWGGVAAVLGFLGQWLGIHRMAQAVAERGIVDPRLVSYGISESLLTPVAGMVVLVGAAFLWFFLRVALWSTARQT